MSAPAASPATTTAPRQARGQRSPRARRLTSSRSRDQSKSLSTIGPGPPSSPKKKSPKSSPSGYRNRSCDLAEHARHFLTELYFAAAYSAGAQGARGSHAAIGSANQFREGFARRSLRAAAWFLGT